MFGFYDRYVTLRIAACAASAITCSDEEADVRGGDRVPGFRLDNYSIDAELINGAPVFFTHAGDEVQLLVFADAFDQDVPIRVKFERPADLEGLGPEVDRKIELTLWPRRIDEVARLKRTPILQPSGATDAQSLPEECFQQSNATRVKCALAYVSSGNRADRLHTVLYSLNFYRKDNVVTDARVNDVDVTFN